MSTTLHYRRVEHQHRHCWQAHQLTLHPPSTGSNCYQVESRAYTAMGGLACQTLLLVLDMGYEATFGARMCQE